MTCKSSSLCLFDEQQVQMDITGNTFTPFYPTTSISQTGPIEFLVSGTPDDYIDLMDSRLYVRVKIVRGDKKKLTDADDKVAFVNQAISTIFQDVSLMLHNTPVEGGQQSYAYNGYLSSLLQFHPSAKSTHMQAWGWNEDEPNKFNDESNQGYEFRQKATSEGKEWELMGPLFLDMARQSRYILPQTDVKIKLHRNKPEFALQTFNVGKAAAAGAAAVPAYLDYDFQITECILYARRMQVMDSVLAGHNKGLDKFNATYPLQRIDINSYAISRGIVRDVKDNLFKSQVPKMIVVGLVEHEAFTGNIKKSPFNFEHHNLSSIGLYRDGDLTGNLVLKPNYAENIYLREYFNTMETLNYFNTDDSNGMTMEHFLNGYNLYAFDLTPDLSSEGSHRHVSKTGSLRLELNFATPLKKPLSVVLFAVLDAKLEIDKLRNVITSYTR